MSETIQRQVLETAGLKPIVTFDFDKWKDKESIIEALVVIDTGKPSTFKNGSSKFLSIESKSLGVHKSNVTDNIEKEYEIKAQEAYAVVEKDGKIIGWANSGNLATLLALAGVDTPQKLIGKKIRSAVKMKKSGKKYLGWNLV